MDAHRLRAGAAAALREGGALLFFAGAAVLVTYPLVFHALRVSGWVPRDLFRDHQVILWDLWWVRHALEQGADPFHTSLLYHPQGTGLFFTPLGFFYGLLAAPFLGGSTGPEAPAAAAQLLAVATFAATGWAAWLLLREVTGSGPGALLGALILACAPFRLFHLPRLHYLSTFWLPLGGWALLRGLRGRPAWGILLGLVFAGGLVSDHHVPLQLAILCATLAVPALIRRPALWRRLLLLVILAGATLVAAAWPALKAAARELRDNPALDVGSALDFEGQPTDWNLILAPDLRNLAYLAAPPLYRLFPGEASPVPLDRQLGVPYRTVLESLRDPGPRPALPELLLAFAGVAAVVAGAIRRGRGVWIALGVLGLVLALGPWRVVAGHKLPMPAQLLGLLLPPLKASRYPASFFTLALLAAAVLAARGIAPLWRRGPRWRWAASAGAGLLLTARLPGLVYPGITMAALERGEAYRVVAAEAGDFAVFELPLGNHDVDRLTMLGQTIHGRPVVRGGLTRVSPQTLRFLESSPLVRRLQDPPPDPDAAAIEEDRAELLRHRFRYVLVHLDWYGTDQEGAARVVDFLEKHRPSDLRRVGDTLIFRFDFR